jgi:hypothetical protein
LQQPQAQKAFLNKTFLNSEAEETDNQIKRERRVRQALNGQMNQDDYTVNRTASCLTGKHQKTRQSSLTNLLQYIINGQGSGHHYDKERERELAKYLIGIHEIENVIGAHYSQVHRGKFLKEPMH